MVEIRGDYQLARLYQSVKATGDNGLRKELLAGIRTATKPLPKAIKAAARTQLPSGGGLGALIAKSSIVSRTRTTASAQHDVGVRLVGQSERPSSKSKRKQRAASGQTKPPSRFHDLAAIDKGDLRHPLFGNRRSWHSQDVEPGFWTETANEHADDVERGIRGAMNDVALKITNL